MPENTLAEKKEIRREIKQKAKELTPAYCRAANAEILRLVKTLPEYKAARKILAFAAIGFEPDTRPILQDILLSGRLLYLPKCKAAGNMEARQVQDFAQLVSGAYGILEPGEEAVLAEPEEMDLVLVPCVACSPDGRRLGHGAGYYDRYLPRTNCPKAVLCRGRLMREKLPVSENDVRMDIVVCERGVLRPQSGHEQ